MLRSDRPKYRTISTDKKIDLAKYKDAYGEKVLQLIEAKVAGREVVAPPAEQEGQILNLMEALKKSVAIVRVAAFYASDEWGWVTGQTLVLAGGQRQ